MGLLLHPSDHARQSTSAGYGCNESGQESVDSGQWPVVGAALPDNRETAKERKREAGRVRVGVSPRRKRPFGVSLFRVFAITARFQLSWPEAQASRLQGCRRGSRLRGFWAKENSQAHGPRGFLASFAVAKKKPRNKALWLVECTRARHRPEEGSRTKGGQPGFRSPEPHQDQRCRVAPIRRADYSWALPRGERHGRDQIWYR